MIELQHITKAFNPGKTNETVALNNVSLQIKTGEFVVAIGANGSGKTTLLNVICGAESVSSGKVLINKNDVTGLPEYKRSKWIARVFQNPYNGTASELSILDNFRLAALRTRQKGFSIGVNPAFTNKVKDQVALLGMGLENKLHRPAGSLSGGQRQALTLLMSIMDDTSVLLLDEPTAALDPKSAKTVLTLASQLIEKYNFTAILVTHNLKDAQQYGNRLIQLHEGKIARDISGPEKENLLLQNMYTWFG